MKTALRTDSALSMGADITGTAFGTDSLDGYSICASWTGTPAGNFKLQACNNPFTDNTDQIANPAAVWVDITGSTTAAGGAAGSYFWNVSDVYYRAFRLVYTRSSGTGSVTAYYFAKGIQ